MDNVQGNFNNDKDMSIKDLILKFYEWYKFLLSKWVVIMAFGIIFGAIGVILSLFKKPIYTAELTFVLENEKANNMGGYASLAGQFGIDMGGGQGGGVFEGDNLLALMESRSMVQKALLTTVEVENKRITLAEFYIDINNLREKWIEKNSKLKEVHFYSNIKGDNLTLEQQSLINSFHRSLIGSNLTVEKKDKKSSIISIQVNSENELFSKYFTEVLAKEVSDFYIETKIKKSVQNLQILQYQTDSVKRAFNSAISGVAASTDATPNINPSRQILRVPSQRRQVDVQINQAILSQLVQNLEMAKVSLRKETPLIQIIDYPVLPLVVTTPNNIVQGIKWAMIGAFAAIFFLLGRKILKDL